MIPCCQYSLLYNETFYYFNFFNCARIQFSVLESFLAAGPSLSSREEMSVSPSLLLQFPFQTEISAKP